MRIIAGEARGRIIEAPEGRNTRPTLDRVRENMFNMLQGEVSGSRILDLFAGSGALSLEALSRGAAFAVLVDSDRKASEVLKKNIEALHFHERTRALRTDWKAAAALLKQEGETFDLVFLDPPYRMTDLREVFEAMVPLIGGDSLIVLEHEAGKAPQVPENYTAVKDRAWGFCAATFYRLNQEGA